MKINEQNLPAKTQLPQKTQPMPLTDESMFDLEELKDEELFGIVGGSGYSPVLVDVYEQIKKHGSLDIQFKQEL